MWRRLEPPRTSRVFRSLLKWLEKHWKHGGETTDWLFQWSQTDWKFQQVATVGRSLLPCTRWTVAADDHQGVNELWTPHLSHWTLLVDQPVGDKVNEPVALSEVGTQWMAQVIVGPDVSQHRHQTCTQVRTHTQVDYLVIDYFEHCSLVTEIVDRWHRSKMKVSSFEPSWWTSNVTPERKIAGCPKSA